MISKEDKQAADCKWRVEWEKLAHGKLFCLFGKWPTHRKPEPFCDPSDTLPHCHCSATIPLKTWRVSISSRKRGETKMLKDSERLVVLCATLPSGTGATAHRVVCQCLSNMRHIFNPIQWWRGGLAASHITYIGALTAYCWQVLKAPASKRFLCGVKTKITGAFSQRGDEKMRLNLLFEGARCFRNTQKYGCWTLYLLQIPSALNYMSRLLHLSWFINNKKLLAEPVNFIVHKVYMTNVYRYCNWFLLAH